MVENCNSRSRDKRYNLYTIFLILFPRLLFFTAAISQSKVSDAMAIMVTGQNAAMLRFKPWGWNLSQQTGI